MHIFMFYTELLVKIWVIQVFFNFNMKNCGTQCSLLNISGQPMYQNEIQGQGGSSLSLHTQQEAGEDI